MNLPARFVYLEHVADFIARHGHIASNDGNCVEFAVEVYGPDLETVAVEYHRVVNMREARAALEY